MVAADDTVETLLAPGSVLCEKLGSQPSPPPVVGAPEPAGAAAAPTFQLAVEIGPYGRASHDLQCLRISLGSGDS
jgi:hypothetical protein